MLLSTLPLIGLFTSFLTIHCSAALNSNDEGFREKPADTSVLLGDNVTLRCSAQSTNGGGQWFSQWRINTGDLLGQSESETGRIEGHDNQFSYIREDADNLGLQIERVSLKNDGPYECQMMKVGAKPLRAAAFLTVLVKPEKVYFSHYKAGTALEVNEGVSLEISCVVPNAKPAADINWYLNGKLVEENIKTKQQQNENKTVSTVSTLRWTPSKNDHNKILTCEGVHPSTDTNHRVTVTLNVLYSSDRPRIDVVDSNSKNGVKAGHNVTLLCTVDGGNPPPRLHWSLNNRNMNSTYEYDFNTQTTRSVYSFIAEGSDNGAVYECSSINRENVAPLKHSVTLDVEYPPSNVHLFGTAAVRRGDSVVIGCTTSPSNPPSVISWLLNGATTKPQPQSEKRHSHGVVTESNFTIDSNTFPSGQHQTSVECVATNNEGSTSQQHIIRVLSPPTTPIIYGFEQGPMLEGEVLNLTCEAHGGSPLATLTWYRGIEKLKDTRSAVSGETAQSVVSFPLDRSMNAQQIRCEAENGALEQPLSASKNLAVLFPPRRISVGHLAKDPHHAIAGEPARLTCTVPSSNPAADITWEFDSGNPNHPLVLHGTYLYNRSVREYNGYEVQNVVTFTPTEAMDKTLARCIASHPLWNGVKSNTLTLNVFYPPRVAVDGSLTIVVGEGETFRENITVFSNPPPIAYRWRKNGVPFEGIIGSIQTQNSAINGKAVTSADSGYYTLIASNRYGNANVTLKLTVEYAARITYVTSPVTAGVGEDVVLECEAEGVPRKHGMVKWLRGNSEMKSIQDEKRAMLRLNASHDTSGAYTCVADNGVGRPNYTTAYLLVKRPPVLLRTPGYDRAAGPVGGRARLRCRAVAVPMAEFSWSLQVEKGQSEPILYNSTKYQFHHTQLDHSTFESTLWVTNLEERDYSRQIRCRAFNRLGDDHTFITIGPPTSPDIPTGIETVKVTNRSAIIRWQPGFDGGSDQIFEIQYGGNSGVRSVNSTASQITLEGLKPAEFYRVQIRSVNVQQRSSSFSSPIEFFTLTKDGAQPYSLASTEDVPLTTILSAAAALVALVILNYVLLICYFWRKHNRKQMKEKTEKSRTLKGTDNVYQPVVGPQMYGAIGTPGMSHRAASVHTNRSEFNDPASEDDSQKTVIHRVEPNNWMPYYDCDSSRVFNDEETDFYAPINKGNAAINLQGTYTSIPYPEPPFNNMSQNNSPPSLRYERSNTLGRNVGRVESPLRPRVQSDLRRAGSPAPSSYAATQSGSVGSFESGRGYSHLSPGSRRNNAFMPPPSNYYGPKQNAYAMAQHVGGGYRTSTDPSLPEGEPL